MSPGSAESLIPQLVKNLKPVRCVPSLSASLVGIFGLALIVAFVVLRFDGPRLDFSNDPLGSGVFRAVLVGLLLAATGGIVGGLSAGIPGREAMVRVGGGVALAGVGAAALVGWSALESLGPQTWSPLSGDLTCFARALGFAFLPLLGMVGLLVRGWVARPAWAALVALLGAVSVGAVVAHLSCPHSFSGARHLLLGHVSVPLAAAMIGAFPLAALFRRFAR